MLPGPGGQAQVPPTGRGYCSAPWRTRSSFSTCRSSARSWPGSGRRSAEADTPEDAVRRDQAVVRCAALRPRLAPRRLPGAGPGERDGGRHRQGFCIGRGTDRSCLFSLVVPAGAATPVHDHLAWGLVGLYAGRRRRRSSRSGAAGSNSPSSSAAGPATSTLDPAARRHPPRADDIRRIHPSRSICSRTTRGVSGGIVRRGVRRADAVPLGLRERRVRRRLTPSAGVADGEPRGGRRRRH